ncbi:MAG TPA: WbqC family protein [Elusimicrobiota bacterium]|nr:WbqC family protein [Elusimicrobiota bacterium]
MIMAAHQPQYLPWLGYFHKMASCDVYVYLDDVQYKKREFQNRNKIRVKDGSQWLTVPVVTKNCYYQEIREVAIDPTSDWGKDHWTAVSLAYSKALFFKSHAGELETFYRKKWGGLAEMSEALIEFHRRLLEIDTPIVRSSEFHVRSKKTERLVALCLAVGADTYLSGQGARDYLDESLFARAGLKVIYQEFKHPEYPQAYPGFEPYMAALDLLLNCGPESRNILLPKN